MAKDENKTITVNDKEYTIDDFSDVEIAYLNGCRFCFNARNSLKC